MLETALVERMKWGLGSIVQSRSQLDRVSWMSSTHSQERVRVQIVQHELHIFGSPFVVVGVVDRSGDAKPPIGMVLHEWRSRMSISWESVDEILVSAIDDDQWRR